MEKNYLPLWETFLWYLLYVNYFIYRKTHIFLDQIHCKKLQYFGHLRWRAKSLEKTLMLGKIEGRKRSWWQRIRWLNGITNSLDMNLNKLLEIVKDREAWCAVVHEVKRSYTRLSDWTTTKMLFTKELDLFPIVSLYKCKPDHILNLV